MADIGIDKELKHHGVKGQRWGIRRTKKQLGYKTGGKKSKKKKPGESDEDKKQETPKKPARKSAKDMSDEELRKAIDRMQLEQRYDQLSPKQVSIGKKVATKVLNDVVIPSATNAGRQFLEKEMKKALGLNQPDPTAVRQKKVQDLNLKKQEIELDEWFNKRGK